MERRHWWKHGARGATCRREGCTVSYRRRHRAGKGPGLGRTIDAMEYSRDGGLTWFASRVMPPCGGAR